MHRYQNDFSLKKKIRELSTVTIPRRATPRQRTHSLTTTHLTHPSFGCSGQSRMGCRLAARPLPRTRRQGCPGQARLSLRRWWQLQKPPGGVSWPRGSHSRPHSHPGSASSCPWSGHSGRRLYSCKKTRRSGSSFAPYPPASTGERPACYSPSLIVHP